jgi:hypothetical protein
VSLRKPRVGDLIAMTSFLGPYACPGGCGGDVFVFNGSPAHSMRDENDFCGWFLGSETETLVQTLSMPKSQPN